MKSTFKIIFVLAAIAVLVAAAEGASGLDIIRNSSLRSGTASTTAANKSPEPPAENNGKKVEPGGRSIEFNQAPVDMVLKVYGELRGVTVLKDPQTQAANITLQPLKDQELTDEDKIEAIETVLEMNGVHLERYGEKFYRAIPRKDVRRDGVPLLMDPSVELRESTRVVSLWLPFNNISVEEAQKALEGFKSANGVLLVFERKNAIVITDTEANIKRMREIAEKIDVEMPVTDNVWEHQIHYASAVDIKTSLEAIVQKSKEEQEKSGKQPNIMPQSTGSASRHQSVGLRKPQTTAPVDQPSLVTSISDADRGRIRGNVMILADERSNKLIIITSEANNTFFKRVIDALDVETTPPTAVNVYRLKYADAEDVSDMINDLIGNAPSSKSNSKSNQNAAAKNSTSGNANLTTGRSSSAKSANKRTGEPQAGELSKENTTVLADKRINGLVVMTQKELVPVIEKIIEKMDVRLSQVLIETCIIEVTLGDDLATGIDWVNNKWTGGKRDKVIGGGGGGTGSAALSQLVDSNKSYADWIKEARDAYGVPSTEIISDDLVKKYINQASQYSSGAAPIASGINYLLKSERLNISAVIQATKSDNRANYLASPIVMTVDNKEATIEATESRKFYSGSTSSSGAYNSNASYNYSDKDLGIKIKVTPKINPNGTVMLEVEEEYSQLGAGQSVLVTTNNGSPSKENIDTALSRKMSADVILEDGHTVVLGGLTEKLRSEKETGVPILKDIPWIGKWLFGSVEQLESRKELLVFMTPYVLDDAESAMVEAMRRKKVLSDQRPWDDNGWSASELADPVSMREQMRRLKDEWKKQDEERKAKLAIEKAKVERVKELRKMSQAERDEWLEMHKEELDRERQRELEEKMQDPESQEELKKFAASLRERNLAEAQAELDKSDEAYKGENERAKMDREKAGRGAPAAEPEEQVAEEREAK